MAIVSISKASRLTGKSRTTLLRHVEQGKLSKSIDSTTNRTGIDTSELIRVYGNLINENKTVRTEQKTVPVVHDVTGNNVQETVSKSDEFHQMREKIAVLETENRMQKELLAEKDKRLLLLENKNMIPKKRKKLFGIF